MNTRMHYYELLKKHNCKLFALQYTMVVCCAVVFWAQRRKSTEWTEENRPQESYTNFTSLFWWRKKEKRTHSIWVGIDFQVFDSLLSELHGCDTDMSQVFYDCNMICILATHTHSFTYSECPWYLLQTMYR